MLRTGLAFTGADPWSMVAIGILLLLMMGGLIVIVGRRNRTDP